MIWRCDFYPHNLWRQLIEIGNYVWRDDNVNGVQNPCETPIPSVTVELWKGVGAAAVRVASTTTNVAGEYCFSTDGVAGQVWVTPGDKVQALMEMENQ